MIDERVTMNEAVEQVARMFGWDNYSTEEVVMVACASFHYLAMRLTNDRRAELSEP
jgi:hypothetical protein